MRDFPCFRDVPRLPGPEEAVRRHALRSKDSVAEKLAAAQRAGTTLIQPRCGVGGQAEMAALLDTIARHGAPDILTLTVDSHTRLLKLDEASRLLREAPEQLNGYPLIAHGHERVRELDAGCPLPLQVRHGSPDARRLFAESVAGGLTSFEGGPIGYNVPYCKRVSIARSLDAWQEIDEAVGAFEEQGMRIDREFFGTLTAVLVPPSIALCVVILEAMMAAAAGARCLSLAYPQGGNLVQDVAALKAIATLSRRYLPAEAKVYPVLHQFMGVFPVDRERAEALIFYGGLTARFGGAVKTVSKTYQEALGVPDGEANAAGVRRTRTAFQPYLEALAPPPGRIEEEHDWIVAETAEIVDAILQTADVRAAIIAGFESGRLDIPFPANGSVKGDVMPVRAADGAIRFSATGRLPFSDRVKARNARELERLPRPGKRYEQVQDSIFYFARQDAAGTEDAP